MSGKIIIIVLLAGVLLASCAQAEQPESSDADIQTAIALHEQIIPLALTPLPLADITLGPDLIQEQDLGLIGGEMHDSNPDAWIFRDVPLGVNNFTRVLNYQDGETAAQVTIMLFDDATLQQQAKDKLNQNSVDAKTQTELAQPIGDWSIANDDYYKVITVSKGPAILVVMSRENSLPALEYYTRSLLERLGKIVPLE